MKIDIRFWEDKFVYDVKFWENFALIENFDLHTLFEVFGSNIFFGKNIINLIQKEEEIVDGWFILLNFPNCDRRIN